MKSTHRHIPNVYVANCMPALPCLQLSKPVAANKGLKVLNLGGNDIGPQGAKALATALKVRTSYRAMQM